MRQDAELATLHRATTSHECVPLEHRVASRLLHASGSFLGSLYLSGCCCQCGGYSGRCIPQKSESRKEGLCRRTTKEMNEPTTSSGANGPPRPTDLPTLLLSPELILLPVSAFVIKRKSSKYTHLSDFVRDRYFFFFLLAITLTTLKRILDISKHVPIHYMYTILSRLLLFNVNYT